MYAIWWRSARFWQTIRTFLAERDFLEVETPILETTPGGAEARPFETHHNALDIDVYLRISAGELWQKKLMVAGIPKTFEIGRIFRNEGMSAEHLQDYSQLEFYQAYSDYEEGMTLITELYRRIATEVFGTTKFSIRGFDIDLADEWERYDFSALIKDAYGIDPRDTTQDEIMRALQDATIEYDESGMNLERGIDLLWKKIRKSLGGPGFLVNVPVALEPLARRAADAFRSFSPEARWGRVLANSMTLLTRKSGSRVSKHSAMQVMTKHRWPTLSTSKRSSTACHQPSALVLRNGSLHSCLISPSAKLRYSRLCDHGRY
jgi:lysyl-tRNA synthetase class II